ncbi:MAG: VOC family protein [Hassallia sp.]
MQDERIVAVESIGMTVASMERSFEFYSKVLSFEKISDVEVSGAAYEQLQGLPNVQMRVVQMQLGSELIELTQYLTPKGRPIPTDSRSNDLWFQHIAIAVSDMDKAYQHLQKNQTQNTSTEPQQLPNWNKAAAGIQAFYFKDPDGHDLELIRYPPGKGDARWQRQTDKLFLGIDHTAIVISDTETSLKFYQDLGMERAGESENYGTEQEHLSRVPNARLRINRLSAPTGPGIELLEYLNPRDGRPIPSDIRTNDLIHRQITLVVRDAEAITSLSFANAQQSTFVSSGVVEMPEQTLGFKKGFLLKDPDGHALRLVEK